MAKRCPFCQKEMPDEANFCLNCFSALGTEASPESCGAKNGNHDEKPTHKHTKKHISKPKAENAFWYAPFCCAVFLPYSQENKYAPQL